MSTSGPIAITPAVPTSLLAGQVIKYGLSFNTLGQMASNVKKFFVGEKRVNNGIRFGFSLGGIGGGIALSLSNPSIYAALSATITSTIGVSSVILPPVALTILASATAAWVGGAIGQTAAKIGIGLTMLVKHGFSNTALLFDMDQWIQELRANAAEYELTEEDINNLKILIEDMRRWMQQYKKGTPEHKEIKQAITSAVKDKNIEALATVLNMQETKTNGHKAELNRLLSTQSDTVDAAVGGVDTPFTTSLAPHHGLVRQRMLNNRLVKESPDDIDGVLTNEASQINARKMLLPGRLRTTLRG